MGKLILLKYLFIIFAILIIFTFLRPVVNAQSNSLDCWNTYMVDQMSVCSKTHTRCVQGCASLDSGKQVSCFNECSRAADICRKQSSADYRACIEAGEEARKQQETKQPESSLVPAEQKPPPKTASSAEGLNDWILDVFGILDPNQLQASDLSEVSNQDLKSLNIKSKDDLWLRPSKWTEKNEAELFETLSKTVKPISPYSVGFINMETEEGPLVKYPGSEEYHPLTKREIPPGSIISSGDNSLGISVGPSEMIFIEPNSIITIGKKETGKAVEKSNETKPVYLHQGELEFKAGKDSGKEDIQIQTDFVDLIVHSHFWVTHGSGRTLVGVYEGNVEVKTKDGKTTMVSPNGDKQGVVVVTQKLLVWKLVLAGLILVVIVGGVILFLRR